MVRAICRRLAPEDGVWGVFAASALAAVLLAALALSLDLAAAESARVVGQAALDASLRAAAHDVVPDSIASSSPSIAGSAASRVLSSSLTRLVLDPLKVQVTSGPTVQGSDLSAQILVSVPLPALIGRVEIPLSGEVTIGWLPR
ncbi:MAG: hypothetical protein M0Z66_13005 [Thermaerobacter sp.]|nr:hypothetical protein [Thermaerobacter sp.]